MSAAAKQAAAAAYRPEWERRKSIVPPPPRLVHVSMGFNEVLDEAGKVVGYRPAWPKGRTFQRAY